MHLLPIRPWNPRAVARISRDSPSTDRCCENLPEHIPCSTDRSGCTTRVRHFRYEAPHQRLIDRRNVLAAEVRVQVILQDRLVANSGVRPQVDCCRKPFRRPFTEWSLGLARVDPHPSPQIRLLAGQPCCSMASFVERFRNPVAVWPSISGANQAGWKSVDPAFPATRRFFALLELSVAIVPYLVPAETTCEMLRSELVIAIHRVGNKRLKSSHENPPHLGFACKCFQEVWGKSNLSKRTPHENPPPPGSLFASIRFHLFHKPNLRKFWQTKPFEFRFKY